MKQQRTQRNLCGHLKKVIILGLATGFTLGLCATARAEDNIVQGNHTYQYVEGTGQHDYTDGIYVYSDGVERGFYQSNGGYYYNKDTVNNQGITNGHKTSTITVEYKKDLDLINLEAKNVYVVVPDTTIEVGAAAADVEYREDCRNTGTIKFTAESQYPTFTQAVGSKYAKSIIMEAGTTVNSAGGFYYTGSTAGGQVISIDKATLNTDTTKTAYYVDAINTTSGDILISNASTVIGENNGINTTTGKITISDKSTLTARTADGITNTTGNIFINSGASVTGEKNGISATTGNVSLKGTSDLTNYVTIRGNNGDGVSGTTGTLTMQYADVVGGDKGLNGNNNISITDGRIEGSKGGIYNTTGSLTITGSTVETLIGSKSGDAINGVGKVINISDSTITGTQGAGIVTDPTATADNNNAVTITNSTVTGGNGDGINALHRTNVTLTDVKVTATEDGVVAGCTGAGIFTIKTTTADSTITAGKSGIVINSGSTLHIAGDKTENINLTDTNNDNVHTDGGLKATTGGNIQQANITNLAVDIKGGSASGVIATGDKSVVSLDSYDNTIKSETGTVNADGVYAENGGSVEFSKGTINLTGTGNVYGVESKAATDAGSASQSASVSLRNLDSNFTVAATGNGVAVGAMATGDGTVHENFFNITVTGTDFDQITAVNGAAYGIEATNAARAFYYASNPSDSGKIAVKTTGSGSAIGIFSTGVGSDVIVQYAKAVEATSAKGTVYGVAAVSSGKVGKAVIDNITVTGGNDATGILASEGTAANPSITQLTLGGAVVVTGTGNSNLNSALRAENYGQNNVTGLEDDTTNNHSAITVKVANGGTAVGLRAFKNSTNTAGPNASGDEFSVDVASTSGPAYGLYSQTNSSNTITGVKTLKATTDRGSAFGAYAEDASINKLSFSDKIDVVGTNLTTYSEIAGVKALSGGQNIFTGTGNTINVTGTGNSDSVANGIDISGGSTVQSAVPFNITVTAKNDTNANGILYAAGTGNNNITNLQDVSVQTNTGLATGIKVEKLATGSNSLTLNGKLNVSGADGVTDNVAYGIFNRSTDAASTLAVTAAKDITVTAPTGIGAIVRADNVSSTTMDFQGALNVTASSAEGVLATSGSKVTLRGSNQEPGILKVRGTGYYVGVGVGIGAQVTLDNVSLDANGGTGYEVLGITGGGTVNLVSSKLASATKSLNAAAVMYTNSYNSQGENLNLNIDSNSSLTGTAQVEKESSANGGIAVNNAGLWNVAGSSNLGNGGSLTNTGTLDMTQDGSAYTKLQVGNLVNNGTVIMNADLLTAQGDQIVANTASGNATVLLAYSASEAKTITEDNFKSPDFVIADNATATYSVGNNGANRLELGTIALKMAPYTNADGKTAYHLVMADFSNRVKAAGTSVIDPDIWYLETDALYEQIGSFDANRKEHDLWARAVHRKLTMNNSFASRTQEVVSGNDLDTNFSGVEIGMDRKLSQNAKETIWGGVMLGYGKGTTDMASGNSDLASFNAGLYSVYKASNGWYLGGLVKYNHYKTDLEASTSSVLTGTEDFSDNVGQNGWGLSAIGGKRFQNNKGWFVEPQLELGYHQINSGDYTLGDMDVKVDGLISRRVRAGVGLGRTISYHNGSNLSAFVKASLIHELDGEGDVRINGVTTLKRDFGGTWGQYKLGLNYNSKRGNNALLALTYEKGGHRSSPLGIEASYNWSF
jgi:outer membrane autotransporter protein